MSPRQEPFVEYIARDGSPSEAPVDHFVLSDKSRVAARTDDLFSDQPGTELVSHEESIDLIASSAATYYPSIFSDNPTLPPNDSPSYPPSNFAGEPAWGISDDEFAQHLSSSVTRPDLTEFLKGVEIPNSTQFNALLGLSEALVSGAKQPFISWSPRVYRQYDNRAHRPSTSRSTHSNFNSPASFMSTGTPGSYMTARSNFNSPDFIDYAISVDGQQKLGTIAELWPEHNPPASNNTLSTLSNDYRSCLRDNGLMPPPGSEINWSGKGQHVEFSSTEEIPIQVLSHLGSSISATVDKVQCKRIILARKMMRCTKNWKAVHALREVEHLHKLRHFHIVQLVGSYLQGRTFSILMYPAANYHLGTFLEDTIDNMDDLGFQKRIEFLASTLSCLSSAVAYIHTNTTKHMDIKPANVLVRLLEKQEKTYGLQQTNWRVYLADFGLSTSFSPQDHSQTDRPTARTAKYCAPEVYNYESHDRSADIFSLGCVFLEILSVICRKSPNEFADFRSAENEDDESFRGNLDRVLEWVGLVLRPCVDSYWRYGNGVSELLDKIPPMLQRDPKFRPSAHEICALFSSLDLKTSPFARRVCCSRSPESYVAAQHLKLLIEP
jgi:serine/threonine protein kinase